MLPILAALWAGCTGSRVDSKLITHPKNEDSLEPAYVLDKVTGLHFDPNTVKVADGTHGPDDVTVLEGTVNNFHFENTTKTEKNKNQYGMDYVIKGSHFKKAGDAYEITFPRSTFSVLSDDIHPQLSLALSSGLWTFHPEQGEVFTSTLNYESGIEDRGLTIPAGTQITWNLDAHVISFDRAVNLDLLGLNCQADLTLSTFNPGDAGGFFRGIDHLTTTSSDGACDVKLEDGRKITVPAETNVIYYPFEKIHLILPGAESGDYVSFNPNEIKWTRR